MSIRELMIKQVERERCARWPNAVTSSAPEGALGQTRGAGACLAFGGTRWVAWLMLPWCPASRSPTGRCDVPESEKGAGPVGHDSRCDAETTHRAGGHR